VLEDGIIKITNGKKRRGNEGMIRQDNRFLDLIRLRQAKSFDRAGSLGQA